MPVARFEMPDGRVARFEVPEGTTPEQAQQMIQQEIGQNPELGGQSQQVASPQSDDLSAQMRDSVARGTGRSGPNDDGFWGKAGDLAREGTEAVRRGLNVPLEAMAGFNQGAVDLAEFLTTDPINAALELSGSETRVPGIGDSDLVQSGTRGRFMEDGLARDVVRGTGQVIPAAVGGGAGLNQMAARLPASMPAVTSRMAAKQAGGRTAAAPVVAPTESTTAGAVRQMGAAAPVADAVYGGTSGAGAAIGEDIGGEDGALIGAILAPMSGASLKGAFDLGKRGWSAMARSVDDMSEEGAATLLADAMVREGLSPDDVAKRLAEMGPEAMPADAGTNFARLLRTASNMVPRVEGDAGKVLSQRQAGQGDRISYAFDDATGIPRLSVDDEITRLNTVLKPKINELYNAASQKPLRASDRLRGLLSSDNSVTRAMNKAQIRLSDKRAAGDQISNINVIDATKQELDDQIGVAWRQGENNKARDLIRLKNVMVEETDKAVPEYKQARDLFAGKAALENAADIGQQFFKMKSRDVSNTVRNMGESEKRMFRLGAKQALVDKLDSMQITRDKVKALFGRGGDAEKLRSAFESPEQFKQFADAMEREANFIRTRRAAQGNSTTAKQLFDQSASFDALESARTAMGDPVAAASAVGRILAGLKGKKGTEANIKAMELAGDILLERGMNPEKVVSILKRGRDKELTAALERVAPKAVGAARRGAVTGTAVEALPTAAEGN